MRRSVHVTYREKDGKWHVVSGDANSKSQKNYATQKEAMEYGKKLAMETSSEFLIHGRDGKIRLSQSYGNDPRNIKDNSTRSKSKPSQKSSSRKKS